MLEKENLVRQTSIQNLENKLKKSEALNSIMTDKIGILEKEKAESKNDVLNKLGELESEHNEAMKLIQVQKSTITKLQHYVEDLEKKKSRHFEIYGRY